MNKMFLSCLKATELIEKKLLFKLSFSEKIRLTMHKMMCDACTLYEKQTNILDKAMDGHPNKDELSVDLKKPVTLITSRRINLTTKSRS